MLIYPGINQYGNNNVGQSARAVLKLDLPETSFMISLLADIEQGQGSLSVKRSETNSVDIAHP
jgi:hypothetical protein